MTQLRGVEIFKVGKWHNIPFSEADLDDMAENFTALAQVQRVPLKLGHSGPVPKGQPSLGWVTSVKRDGQLLRADFDHVPESLAKAIKQKRYRTVSIELLMGAKLGQKVYRHVLDAVALLGADQPAVHGLGDLDQFLAERSVAFDDAGHCLVFETTAGNVNQTSGETMNEEQIKAAIAAGIAAHFSKGGGTTNADLEAEVLKLRKEKRDLEDKLVEFERKVTKLEADRAEFDRTAKKAGLEAKRKQAKGQLEVAVKARVITPAQREQFTRQYALDDDAQLEKLDIDTFKKAFEVPEPQRQGQRHFAVVASDRTAFTKPDAELTKLANEDMVKTGEKDFMVSFGRVAAANPELYQEYRNMNRKEA